MKFHNITSVGKFILQKLTSLPVFTSADEGRVVYNSTNKKPYISTDEAWKQIGGGIGDLNSTFTAGDTLSDGYLYAIDTQSAPTSAYLSATPTTGDLVSVYDEYNSFTTNNFTIYGNGNNISGNVSLTLTVDGSIASFIYDTNEWKANIGGSSSVSPSGNLNFATIVETTSMEAADTFVMLDETDGLNKKVTLTNWFSNLNIDSNLDVLASATDDDYFIIYDTTTGLTKKILASNVVPDGSTQINRLDIKANDMFLDDTLTGVSYGSAFGLYKTIDFSTTTDGACWLHCKFPSNWSTSTDLQININYSLSGSDPAKTVRINTDFWSVSETDTPTSVTSDITIVNSDIITSAATNISMYDEVTLTAIGNAYIDSGIKSFAIKLTRDVSEDTYSGSLQLISVDIYQ